MSDVYTQKRTAFRNVSAAVIVRDGVHIADVAIKDNDRADAYLRIVGIDGARGSATGYNYDRQTAAVANAAKKIRAGLPENDKFPLFPHTTALLDALEIDGGRHWYDCVDAAGFRVFWAI